MRDRSRLPVRSRRPKGPPQATGRGATPPRTGRPVLEMPIDLGGLARLRATVAAQAGRLGAGARREDIVLVVHELATNVVRHGGGTGSLRLWRVGRQMICRVSDSGPGLGVTGDDLPGPGAPGGRGLWIARRLADVRIETGSSGTVVVAVVELPEEL